jgi:F-type H+-transporting ATPase subunit c
MSIIPLLAEAAQTASSATGLVGNLHIGLAALGAAIGVGLIGMKASEAVGRNPGAATPILIQAILSTAFAEGIVFFAIFLASGK